MSITGEEIVVAVANDLRDENTPRAETLWGYLTDSAFARDMRDYATAQLALRESKPAPEPTPKPAPDPTFTAREIAARFLWTIGNGPNYGKAISGWLRALDKTLAAMFETGNVGRNELENAGIKIRSPSGISKFPSLDLKSAFLAAAEERDGEIIGWITNGFYAFGPVPVPDGSSGTYQKVGGYFYLVPKDYDPTAPEQAAWSELIDMGRVVPTADLRDGSWTKNWTEIFPVGVLISRGDPAWESRFGDTSYSRMRFFPACSSCKQLELALGSDLRKVYHTLPPKLLFSKTLGTGSPPDDFDADGIEYGSVSPWARKQGMEIWGAANLTYMLEAWAWATQQPRPDLAGTRFFAPQDNPLGPIVVLSEARVWRAEKILHPRIKQAKDTGGDEKIQAHEPVAIVMPLRLD